MSFTKTRATIEEEGIVASAGGIYDAFSCRDGEVVIGANDEIIKGVFLVETITTGEITVFAEGFNMRFDSVGTRLDNFTRADFGFDLSLDLKIDSFDIDIVVFEGGSDNI